MNNTKRAPNRPDPNVSNTFNTMGGRANSSASTSGRLHKIKMAVLFGLIFIVTLLIAYTFYTQSPFGDSGPTVKLYDQFIDLDFDGDLDYLKEGKAILNCGGVACDFSPTPAAPALPAPPTPQIQGQQPQYFPDTTTSP